MKFLTFSQASFLRFAFRKSNYLFLLVLLLFSLSSCRLNRWLTGYIPNASIPDEYANTVLLVSAFEYVPASDIPRGKRKVVKYTNRHLSRLNSKLVRVWDHYPYPHKIVKFSQIDSLYPNTDQYRYIVCRTIVFRFTRTVNGPAYDTYQYYFFDRKRRLIQPDIGIYSSFRWKTTRVLIHKLKKAARFQVPPTNLPHSRKDKLVASQYCVQLPGYRPGWFWVRDIVGKLGC